MFRRGNRGVANDKGATTQTTAGRGYGSGQPFRFGTWLRLHGFDLFTMLLAGVAGLGIYYAPPAYDRWFAITFQDGEIVYPTTAVPMQKDLVPIWAAAFLAFMLPLFFFLLFQIRIRSMDHLFTTVMGLLKSLITAALFQVVIKCLVGGPRPHFLVVCNPQIPDGVVGSGYRQLYFTREVCTGDKKAINDALESLPSGHATAAFAGFIFLSLYFNAQLKLLSSHNPAYWKMLLFMGPILGAMLIALVMTMDGFHHWWDVTVGGLIGTACAFVAFRSTFASIWDFRFNHVLLPRTGSLFLRRGFDGAGPLNFNYVPGALGQWPVTREAGWGQMDESANGAPFDASANGGVMGAGNGMGMGNGMGAHDGLATGNGAGAGNGLGAHGHGPMNGGTHAAHPNNGTVNGGAYNNV